MLLTVVIGAEGLSASLGGLSGGLRGHFQLVFFPLFGFFSVFGVAASALSIAALCYNCLETFGCVQFGRHFSSDYNLCRLQLDICEVRLKRWADAINISANPRFAVPVAHDTATVDRDIDFACNLLLEMADLLQTTISKSRRYELNASADDKRVYEDRDMVPVYRRLHQLLRRSAASGPSSPLAQTSQTDQASTPPTPQPNHVSSTLAPRAAWALYNCVDFRLLLMDMAGLTAALEQLFPAEDVSHRLAAATIEDVHDQPGLGVLHIVLTIDSSIRTDHILLNAVERKGEALGYSFAHRTDATAVQIGDHYTTMILAMDGFGPAMPTNSAVRPVTARGSARVEIGNQFVVPGE